MSIAEVLGMEIRMCDAALGFLDILDSSSEESCGYNSLKMHFILSNPGSSSFCTWYCQ